MKRLFDLVEYKKLVKTAEKTGLIVDLDDSELITLTSASGTVFNDTLDYDVINYQDAENYPEYRREFFRIFRNAIDNHRSKKKRKQ